MSDTSLFTPEEQEKLYVTFRELLKDASVFKEDDAEAHVHKAFHIAMNERGNKRVRSGRHAIYKTLDVSKIVVNEIGLGKTSLICTLLYDVVHANHIPLEEIKQEFSQQVVEIIRGLDQASALYEKSAAIETENFRQLLLTFARDIRVILIMVADRLHTMRHLQYFSEEDQLKIARETSYLYAPLAHRLGLYTIKSELEDLSLKYTNRELYKEIAKKLNETKQERETYIANFIDPIKKKLEKEGFKFEIKGRTKTIFSILNKMSRNTPFEDIYDLFAIRIILDTKLKNEKSDCWRVYSIITDMYSPNPKRLRDWLSIPKSNGYESLHTTVMGPDGKWVEVQIRTVRMNEIAEKGLAAHWRYKGIKSEKGLDEWLMNIREILENPEKNAVDFIDDFKLGLYEKEVFVFTPKGDLKKLPLRSTVLDFAFDIHTAIGSKCVGAKVNGKNVPIRHQLNNGDQVEILTNNSQKPKQSWLQIVTTSKAKTKIKQALKEAQFKEAELGREMLRRRFRNWKINIDDGRFQRMVHHLKFNTTTDFYCAISNEEIELAFIRETYQELERKETSSTPESQEIKTAGNYNLQSDIAEEGEDVLTIDEHLKNIDFTLAKCCKPIYGDDIFGFVGSSGGIKIHRTDCPNAPQMINRFGYRIVKAQWSGKAGTKYEVTIQVTGEDDIGIVSNISSVIANELKVKLRSINIDSGDGVFNGTLTLSVSDISHLNSVLKKIQSIRGVLNVKRLYE
ncbi:RelA/SpoT family protein [Saccharicrinis sp. FJH2]|uniref:RelA/SpoT family protein n=1 Tax=Saccharicrinis sp. FJH65 TaxID=3344659 RepID=UPI0035F2CAA0